MEDSPAGPVPGDPETAGPEAAPKAPAPDPRLAAAELRFPVTFDLRIIYLVAEGPSIQADLERIYAARGVACSMMQGMGIPGSKYARMGSRLTFTGREQMYGTYEDIGRLAYVKSAI